jgi:hypothetical protein
MADELEANVELTFELIRDDGVKFTRPGWRMYQHIYNRTIRTYLATHKDGPWQKPEFRKAMLDATRRIREGVLAATKGRPVDLPTFKSVAIKVMKGESDAFVAAQARAPGAPPSPTAPLGPVCSDYLAHPDEPPPE